MARAAAGMLFTDRGRVLLVQNSYKTDWNLPGGIINLGETPTQAAAREVEEELGFYRMPRRLLVVDNVVVPSGELLVVYVFNGGELDTNRIRIDNDEIIGWEWCDTKQVFEKTPTAPIFRNRILHALGCVPSGGRPKYLENGDYPERHGTRHRYLKGCGCPPCAKANSVYVRDYRRQAARKPSSR